MPPVPRAVDALIGDLNRRSYVVVHLEAVNAARLVLLERAQER